MTFEMAMMDAYREGYAEAVETFSREAAQRMAALGLSLNVIAQSVGVSEQQVAAWLAPSATQWQRTTEAGGEPT